ncbi:hypothetical protein [Vulcanisaeta souniana]|uniref:hypothetical protein n=1 Tax=Vulcanisaeta souniana TaxID=164452 RepID=UPI0006CFE061|nr:hypothetical protein [Vulcanisaeta souniana]
MRLRDLVLALVIALMVFVVLTNPAINELVTTGIEGIINYVFSNATGVPTLITTAISGPCSFQGGLVNINLTGGESLFIEVMNGSYVYLLTNSQLRGWGGGGPEAPGNYTWSSVVPGIYVVNPGPGNYSLLVCGNTGITYRVLNYTAMGVAAYYGPNYGNITTNAVLGVFNITNAYVENSTGAHGSGLLPSIECLCGC